MTQNMAVKQFGKKANLLPKAEVFESEPKMVVIEGGLIADRTGADVMATAGFFA